VNFILSCGLFVDRQHGGLIGFFEENFFFELREFLFELSAHFYLVFFGAGHAVDGPEGLAVHGGGLVVHFHFFEGA